MIRLIGIILLALMSAAQAQNPEAFQNYMASRPSANTTLGITDSGLVMQGGTVKRVPFASVLSSSFYTPPGTGGVATSVPTVLNRVLWANDFGAVCNGVTDDHVAFQNAITAALAQNAIFSWLGTCRISATLNVPGALVIRGTGMLASGIAADTNITVFHNTSFGMRIQDLNIQFNNAAPCGSAQANTSSVALQLDTSSFNGPYIENVWINCAHTGVFVNGVSEGTSSGLIATNISKFAFDFEFASGTEGGDWDVTNSNLQPDGVTAGVEAVHCGSCWGLRYTHNKTNGIGPGFAIGINLNPTNGDGDLFLTGNSFEGINSGPCVQIKRANAGVFGGNVVITGNEFTCSGLGSLGINMPTDTASPTSQWFTGLTIVGNVFNTINDTVHVDNMILLTFAANTLEIATTATQQHPINVGTHVVSGTVGPNICAVTNFSLNTGSGCTASIISGTGITTITPF